MKDIQVDLTNCLDFQGLTFNGYRITTRSWTWEDVGRILTCYENTETANEFVKCLGKRRTDALAIRRYLNDIMKDDGNIVFVVPPVVSFSVEGEGEGKEGEGEPEGTCTSLMDADPIVLPLWINPECAGKKVMDAVESFVEETTGREFSRKDNLQYPLGIEIRPISDESREYLVLDNTAVLEYNDHIVCSGEGAGEQFAELLQQIGQYRDFMEGLIGEETGEGINR